MVSKEWTTIRVRWETKKELLKHLIGRETDDDVLQRVLKMNKAKEKKEEKSPEHKEMIDKLNRPSKVRKR